MKIFISGSIAIKTLDNKIHDKLNSIIEKGHFVILGDAPGIDSNVQKYLFENNYRKVTVYYAGETIRNNIGKWEVKQIVSGNNLKGRELFTLKDIEMAKDADFGFMIWDGNSKGTKNNIKTMLELNKRFLIYINGQFFDAKSFDYNKYFEKEAQLAFF